MLQLTPEQRTVLTLLALGLVLVSLPVGHWVIEELPYRYMDTGPTAFAVLGVACLIGAWTVAKVLKLRK